MSQEELKHHGVIGMHWGIRRYQPYPKGSKKAGDKELVKKRNAGLKKTYSKSEKKLRKIQTKADKKRAKTQKYADKYYKEQDRLFSSKRRENKYEKKMIKSNKSVRRLEQKGAKWYRAMEKNYGRVGVKQSKAAKAMGEDFIRRVNDRYALRAELSDFEGRRRRR